MTKYKKLYEVADSLATRKEGFTTLKKILKSAYDEDVPSNDDRYNALQKKIRRIIEKDPNVLILKGENLSGFRYREGYEHYMSQTKEDKATKKKQGDERRLYLTSGLSMILDSETASEPMIEFECIERLHNLNLVKQLLRVLGKKVICFRYHRNYEEIQTINLHPHLLKEYNSRFYVWGYVGNKDIVNFAIDRILTLDDALKRRREELKGKHVEEKDEWNDYFFVTDDVYKKAPRGTYGKLFKDIVGVTYHKERPVETFTIRTTDAKVHNLIETKPIHNSQVRTRYFNEYDDGEGEFEITVIPNIELRTKLLSFGAGVYVMGDGDFQKDIREQVKKMAERYQILTDSTSDY